MNGAPQMQHDAIIVGAGAAGAAAATWLARGGWSVVVVEKQPFPRRKVCGECIAAGNLPLLHDLGLGPTLQAMAGAELHRVTLLHGQQQVTAQLPAHRAPHPWGVALGRETLDNCLLEAALAAGADVLQPFVLQAITGAPGAWQCEARELATGIVRHLSAPLLIDAHGSWEDLPSPQTRTRPVHEASDLLAFKANFVGATLDAGTISVLALDGGYGGMVQAGGGVATVACCVRRDRLSQLRSAAPGVAAGQVVQDWLLRTCSGVQRALQGATRDGSWLAAGPIQPGLRLQADDGIFRIGNAAGEAHPILGEGLSMALQSAAMLSTRLLQLRPAQAAANGADIANPANPANAADEAAKKANASLGHAAWQATAMRQYTAHWRRSFTPRLRLAAVLAHAAMRPQAAALLLRLATGWPGLLTTGARWGGKSRPAALLGRPTS